MPTTASGWPVLTSNRTTGPLPRLRKWIIPGTDRHVFIRDGSIGFCLTYLAVWFHRNVEPINEPLWDEWGYAYRPVRGSSSWSNHAGGVAIDLNATDHPLGVWNTFSREDQAKIRAHLADTYDGLIRWGGDYRNRPDDMHFEAAPGTTLAHAERVAASLVPTPLGQEVLAANPGAYDVIADGNPHLQPPTPPEPPRQILPPHPSRLDVASCNLFVSNRDPAGGPLKLGRKWKRQARRWPDVIGLQEARLPADLRLDGIGPYAVVADGDDLHSRGVAVLVNRKHRILEHELIPAAEGVPDSSRTDGWTRIAKPRSIQRVRLEHRRTTRPVTVLNTHMHVVPVGQREDPPTGLIARQYAAHAAQVAALVTAAEEAGDVVVVTADGNAAGMGWPHALPNVLRRLGMTVHENGPDLVAMFPDQVALLNRRGVIDKAVTGSDTHNAVVLAGRIQ